ncbi:hypothetical protein DVH24_021934 [Malus domestica]|uniref:IMP dehydrogenase/GMP reductase domain-containing protein n=1 Tax=Malus domestica TaxID=3750 RepID=A0A498IZB9_MALDO|nr:hypothetical protein DVH24_021934 [Malus domestica]
MSLSGLLLRPDLSLEPGLSHSHRALRVFVYQEQNGRRVKKYRGMGSLEAMTNGSDQRYLGDTAKLKIAQGVVGAVADKGSVLKFIPYTMQAVKQGFQDLGASSLQSAHDLLKSSVLRLEVRTGAAQVEGGVHGLLFSFLPVTAVLGNWGTLPCSMLHLISPI